MFHSYISYIRWLTSLSNLFHIHLISNIIIGHILYFLLPLNLSLRKIFQSFTRDYKVFSIEKMVENRTEFPKDDIRYMIYSIYFVIHFIIHFVIEWMRWTFCIWCGRNSPQATRTRKVVINSHPNWKLWCHRL